MGEPGGEAAERIALEPAIAETIDAETAVVAAVPAAIGTESTVIDVLWMLSGEVACSIRMEGQIRLLAFKLLVRDATGVDVDEQLLQGPSGADLRVYIPTERGTAQTVFLLRDPNGAIPELDRPHVKRMERAKFVLNEFRAAQCSRVDFWFCVLCHKCYNDEHAESKGHMRRLRGVSDMGNAPWN